MTEKQTVTIDGKEYEMFMRGKSSEEDGTERDCIYLKEVKKEPKEWPRNGSAYFCVNGGGGADRNQYGCTDYDNGAKAIGNCYKTEAQAQAVIDLKKHIHKFEMPEEKHNSLELYIDGVGQPPEWVEVKFYGINNISEFKLAGTWLPITATKKDKTERVRLLKLVHGA